MTFLNISFLSETLNLTIDQINGILRTLNTSTKFANTTIERNFKAIDIINFSIEGILLPLLCLIGLTGIIYSFYDMNKKGIISKAFWLGNLLSIYILLKTELYLKKSYHQLSLSQLVWNTLFLISSTILHSSRHFSSFLWTISIPVLYPITHICLYSSIYTMLLLTAHRYCAICFQTLPCRYKICKK